MRRLPEKKLKGDSRDKRGLKTERKPRTYVLRKKKCRFCKDENLKIDYLEHQFLRRFTTERGKIVPSRISGNCAKHQRKLAVAIKRARNIGLLPFLAD
ncbi:MAG: 30S ribosomal protein S18 [Candidatus Omnitrophota bacterium]